VVEPPGRGRRSAGVLCRCCGSSVQAKARGKLSRRWNAAARSAAQGQRCATSGRLSGDTIELYADPEGSHTERLIDACWTLGVGDPWRRMRRWAHMLGFGGHFLTKSRGYSITFKFLRGQRVIYQQTITAGPEQPTPETPTTLVVNFLQYVGAGWHNTGDAMLASTSAALAREYTQLARAELAALAT
jgi:hypothetical protein